MLKKRNFWITICLFNLCIVALLGFALRSKILFTIPFLHYRNVLSAHSHFAFAGWAGLGLMTLMIYRLLPSQSSGKKTYTWILASVQISSIGMAVIFPFYGYNAASLFFSTLYIVATMVFAPVFLKDLFKTSQSGIVKLLTVSSIVSLILSYLGTLGLVYILSSKSSNALLYRDSIYTFLHFQYNGFFTLGVFALFFQQLHNHIAISDKKYMRFSILLCASVIPSLFLSLLWHNNTLFYLLGGIGSILILSAIFLFFRAVKKEDITSVAQWPVARTFLWFAGLSFVLKMLLSAGTIIPVLANAVYGDRPVIIGFLHLVFLGFLSFYLLASFTEDGIFTRAGRVLKGGLILFTIGIFLNELLLFLQGFVILLNFNSVIFQWLLWGAAIVLFLGAVYIFITRLIAAGQKKSTIDVVPL